MIAFCLGAAMYYYVMYRFRLIPRWLSVWGLVALALSLDGSIDRIRRKNFEDPGMQVLLALPILVQEMFLAVWLIVKGFDPSAIASGSPKTDTNEVK